MSNQFFNSILGSAATLFTGGSQPAVPEDAISRMYQLREDVRRCREHIAYYEKSVITNQQTLADYRAQLPTLEAALQLEIDKFKGEK